MILPRRSRVILVAMVAIGSVGCSGPEATATPSPSTPTAAATPAVVATTAPPPPPTPTASADLASRLDGIVAAYDGINGSVLIALGDRVLLSKGYGLADTEHAIANHPTTRFRLGSVTKQFTAMAILILESRGKLDVDDRACRYLTGCRATWKAITIRQLLNHTAGIPNFTELPDYEATKNEPTTPAGLMARVRDLPLDFEPGTSFRYSNSGYAILGLIIERASGESYEHFLRANIFEPLGMVDTGYEHPDSHLASGYKTDGVPADPIDMSVPYAAGGLYSTVLDLHRWAPALTTDRLVPTALLAEMVAPSGPTSGIGGADYGFGIAIATERGHLKLVHDGAIDGFHSYFAVYPDDGLVVAFLSNREPTGVFNGVDQAVAEVLLP